MKRLLLELSILRELFKVIFKTCLDFRNLRGFTILWTEGLYKIDSGDWKYGTYYRYLKETSENDLRV